MTGRLGSYGDCRILERNPHSAHTLTIQRKKILKRAYYYLLDVTTIQFDVKQSRIWKEEETTSHSFPMTLSSACDENLKTTSGRQTSNPPVILVLEQLFGLEEK